MHRANAIPCLGTLFLMAYQMSAQIIHHHGGECTSDSNCMDHRMSCLYNGSDSNRKFCLCNRFFTWDEEVQQCVQVANMSAKLMTLLEQQDNHSLNSISEHETFIKLGVVGLISVFSICIFILCCIAYGCCACTRTNDKSVSTDKEALCPPTCPLHKVPLKEGETQKGDDKWKDMCTVPPSFDDIDI